MHLTNLQAHRSKKMNYA